MRRHRRPQFAFVALLVLLCVGLALLGGTVDGILPPVATLVTTLDRGALLPVAVGLVVLEPPTDAYRSRGPPLPRSL